MTVTENHKVNFEHRIEALTLALNTLKANPKAETAARQLAVSIRASSELRGLTALAESARRAEAAASEDLESALRQLISTMQAEAAIHPCALPCVLIVTADQVMLNTLRPMLEKRRRTVLACSTTREALQLTKTNDIASIILDIVLPGQDGRRLIIDLRSDPATAAMPILAMGPLPAEQENGLVHAADIYLEKPVDPAAVVESITQRLKRDQEHGRKARRDVATGVPNRAAFCEVYQQAAADCATNREPLALAILGVYRFEALMQECGATADDLIRRIGSTVSGCFRTTDTVARWSTTEFAVILPGEDHYGAIRAVEKAMEALNRLVVPGQDGQDHSVTLCAGLAIANEKTPLDEAVSQAERNLCESFADCQASGSSSIVAPDARQTPRRTERVAICVADIKMGRAIGQMLERDRFTIKLFATAEELLTGLSERRFNLLIADDELPLGGETHLLERIRALRQCSRLRIIMLVAGESSIVRVMELGADDYAIKPPDITSFISRIRRLLSGSEALSQRHTVMILDHEIPQLLVAGTTLYKRCGCRVLLAHGVEDALQRLSADTPDFLILDLDIPESSLKHFISLLPRNKDLEIITAASSAATTADISTEDFRVRGHLTRPFKPDTLLKEFRGIIPLAGEPPKSKGSEPDIIDVEIRRILTLRR